MEAEVGSQSSEVELADMKGSKKTKPAEMKSHGPPSKKEGEEIVAKILRDLTAREEGLTDDEVEERREHFGLNALPKQKGSHKQLVFANQFSESFVGVLQVHVESFVLVSGNSRTVLTFMKVHGDCLYFVYRIA